VTGLWAPLIAVATTQTVQAPPVFKVGVEWVYVDAFATRKGLPMNGLQAKHFEVVEDGKVQQPELVDLGMVPLQVTFVFDASGSVGGPQLRHLRDAARSFLSGMRSDDRSSLLTFSQEIARPLAWTADPAVLERALAAIQAGGRTALFDALFVGLVRPSGSGRSMLLVFSDGDDNLSWLREEEVQRLAFASDVVIHAVGIRSLGSNWAGPLRTITEATGGRFWEVSTSSGLRDTFLAVLAAMRQRYLLRYLPPGGTRPGLHRIEVHLRGVKGEVNARKGYFVAAPIDEH
jgi:Ca-activated chloride channel family protein